MKKVILAVAALVTFGPSAFANTYVICGEKVDADSGDVRGFELELSSQWAGECSGQVGKKWNMKLGGKVAEWLAQNKKITATTLNDEGFKIVSIQIETGRTTSGQIGTKYVLHGLYDENPVLKKYTTGGYSGTVEIGTFECVSGND